MSIPVLFDATETEFTSHGIGDLTDVIEWYVEEQRNGAYELELTYPADGIHGTEIEPFCYILAKPNYEDDPQPFVVYKVTTDISGKMTVYGRHISYCLDGYVVYPQAHPFTSASSAIDALSTLPTLRDDFFNLFSFDTDINKSGNWTPLHPSSLRSWFAGQEGSLIDVYGGEWYYDGFDVYLLAHRGSDNGVVITYGKDLTEFEKESSINVAYSMVGGYWMNDAGEQVYGTFLPTYASVPIDYVRTEMVDFSSEFQEKPTENMVTAKTQEYINRRGTEGLATNVKFNYEQLSDVAEEINLCDTVTVRDPFANTNYQAKVIRTKWAGHLDRYSEVEVGSTEVSSWTVSDLADTSNKPESAVRSPSDRSIIIVSDSYGDKVYSGDDANGVVFQDVFRTICPPNWSVYTAVQSGASFLGLSNNTNLKFINVLKSVTGVSSDVGITDVVVVGGWNDVDNLASGSTVANLRTAIKEFCDYCTEKYPNASVLLCPVGTDLGNTTKRIAYRNMLDCYTKPVNARFSAMQDADCVLTSTTMFRADQWVHPNDAGGEAIATALLNTLSGQGVGIHRQWWSAVNGGAGDLSGVVESIGSQISTLNSAFYQYQNGREATLLMFNTSITTTGGKAWGGNPSEFQNICTLKDPIFVGSQYGDFQTVVPVLVQDTSNNWHDLTGILRLNGKKVQLSLQNITSSGYTLINTKWLGIAGNTVIHGDAGLCNL